MKKFYAMMAAVVLAVSAFAAPTAADLAKYQKAGYYVACFGTPADATCNEIVWVGTYNGWKLDDPDIIVCEAVTGFDGYYVAVVPVGAYKDNDVNKEFDPEGECSGKPVQRNECGKLEWAFQNGGTGACTLVSGEVTINEKGAETDLVDWSKTQPTIIDIAFWKEHANPCAAQCAAVNLTIRVYDPFCESNPEFEPTMRGSFNNWGDAVKMTFKGSYYEYVIEDATASLEFKFNNDAAGSWDNQFQYYIPEDEENDTPAKWVNFENFNPLAEEDDMAQYYTKEGNVVTFNFADGAKYRYASCGAEVGEFEVTVNLKTTADAPAAGIEMAGSFASDDWTVFQPMELKEGVYTATLTTEANKEFKFREAGSWDNEIVYKNEVKDGGAKGLDNIKFGDVWKDAGEGKKVIDLDYSDAAVYCWKASWVAPEEGIEDIVLTEKAHKVVVDGVIYIVRDNKMFNLQGAQVR